MASMLTTAGGVFVISGTGDTVQPDRYAGADIVVAGRQRMPNPTTPGEQVTLPERVRVPLTLAPRLRSIDGVREVAADLSLPITMATSRGAVVRADDRVIVGHGWSTASLWPVGDLAGRAPRAAREVAVDAALAASAGIGLGERVRIMSAQGTQAYEVVGVVSPRDRRSRRQAPVFFTDEVAHLLTIDPRQVDVLGVVVEPGVNVDRVAARIRTVTGSEFDVLTGRARARPESLDIARQNAAVVEVGGAFGGTATLLAVIVVAATLGMSVLQRWREIALLRAVGATPRQVRRMIVAEAALVATAAGAVGALPGYLLAASLIGVLRRTGLAAPSTSLRLNLVPALVAIGVGIVVASLAALLAARRATRIHPTAALQEAAVERDRLGWVRSVIGATLVVGGVALSVLAGSLQSEAGASASVGVLLVMMAGVAVLGPALARVAATLLGPAVAPLSHDAGFLASAHLRARTRRLASASTPVALAVAVTLTMVGSLRIEARAVDQQTRERLVADRMLAAPGGLSLGFADDVRAAAGVTAAVDLLHTEIGIVRHELFGETAFAMLPAVGISDEGIGKVLDLDLRRGHLTPLTGDRAAVSTELARSARADVGDTLRIWLGDGTPRRVVVAAVFDRSLGFADLILPKDAVVGHVTAPTTGEVLVAMDNSAGSAFDAAVRALDSRPPGLRILAGDHIAAAAAADAQESSSVNYLFVAILAAFVAMSMVNALILATGERARELALLRLIGATDAQVVQMVRWETVILVSFAAAVGLAVAAATLIPFSLGIADSSVPALPLPFLISVLLGAYILAALATEIPARTVFRRDPLAVVAFAT